VRTLSHSRGRLELDSLNQNGGSGRNIYMNLHTRETCGVNVDKQDFNFNEVEDVESLPMKHFDNAFGTVLSAQTFAEVIFGL